MTYYYPFKQIFLVFLASLFLSFTLNIKAQAPTGTNAANYVFSTIPPGTSGVSNSFSKDLNGNIFSMSTGTTTLIKAAEQNKNSSTYLAPCFTLDPSCGYNRIGFDFYFMGMRANEFVVNSEGILGFPRTPTSSESEGVNGGCTRIGEVNQTDGKEGRISAFTGWYARTYPTTGKVSYKTIGTAPFRTLVVEWKDIDFRNNANTSTTFLANFQVRLYETTNKIEYVYGNMNVGFNWTYQSGFSYGTGSGQFATIKSLTSSGFEVNTTAPASFTSIISNPITSLNSDGGDGFRRQILFDPITGTTNLPPKDLTVLNGTDKVTLSWTDAPNELSYDIYWSLKPEVPLDGTSGHGVAPNNAEDFIIGDVAVTPQGNITSASKTINFGNIPVDNVWVGASISGTGIPPGTIITAINYAANSITLSNAATSSGSSSLTTGINPTTKFYYKVFARREALSEAASTGTPTFINDNKAIDFTIFPNPANKVISLQFISDEKHLNVSVYSFEGRKIMDKKVYSGEILNLSDCNSGLYFLELSDGKGNRTSKRIVLE